MFYKELESLSSFYTLLLLLFLSIRHQGSDAVDNHLYRRPSESVASMPDTIEDYDSLQNTALISPEAQALQQQQQLLHRASQPTNCENITNSMCSHLAYKSTRMPNFYQDLNQIEASERALMLQELVNTNCNPNIRMYVCELLFPVCLDDRELMERFHIYPCKSFCRRLLGDCRADIQLLIEKHGNLLVIQDMIRRTFSCDFLPFESNPDNGLGSNRSLSNGNVGPCHEITDMNGNNNNNYNNDNSYSNNNNQIESGWNPYKPDRDNVPNLMMVNPNLDQEATSNILNALQSNPRLNSQNVFTNTNMNNVTSHQPQTTMTTNDKTKQLVVPINNNNKPQQHQNQQQHQQLWYSNALASLQNLLKFVSRYSEIIAIFLIICLVLVLNSHKLHRLKSYLRLASHSSSSSNNSSQSSSYRNQLRNRHLNQQSSKQALGINQFEAGVPGNPIVPDSPSSSSRSLVMITATNNGNTNNGNLSHHLLSRHQLDRSQDSSPPISDVTGEQKIMKLTNNQQHKMLNNHHGSNNNQMNEILLDQHNHLVLQGANHLNSNQRKLVATRTTNQFNHHNNNNNQQASRATGVPDFDRELILSQVRCSNLANQLTNTTTNKHFFNTLDSSKSCVSPSNNNNKNNNHYDYISNSKEDLIIHPRSNHQQQAQLYSNILLSSPSHQVLLFDPPTGTAQHQISQDDNINNNSNNNINQRNLRMLNNYHGQSQQQISNSTGSYATPTILSDTPTSNGQQQPAFDGRRQFPRVFEKQQQQVQQMSMRSSSHKTSYGGGGASGPSHRATSSKRRCKPPGHASLSSACSSAGADSDSMANGFASSSSPISLSRRQS